MLWLLRHAEAAEGRPDEARPLTTRGIRQAEIAGIAMQRLGIHLDTCLSSPKRRTMETAALACEPLGLEILAEPALAGPDWDGEQLAAGQGDVLLVGHNPSMSDALRALTGARVQMKKGGLAAVRRGELVVLMTPNELGMIAGTPETDR